MIWTAVKEGSGTLVPLPNYIVLYKVMKSCWSQYFWRLKRDSFLWLHAFFFSFTSGKKRGHFHKSLLDLFCSLLNHCLLQFWIWRVLFEIEFCDQSHWKGNRCEGQPLLRSWECRGDVLERDVALQHCSWEDQIPVWRSLMPLNALTRRKAGPQNSTALCWGNTRARAVTSSRIPSLALRLWGHHAMSVHLFNVL